ncbi:hypothetical protein [Mesorhizobium sp. LjRoot246]|uniref:hypothetical protein n=1 Tax=Mesorhizobium sp. LjRoot246 TaxID=3342294 RepID=UPI003ED0604F
MSGRDLSQDQRDQLAKLAELSDSEIDILDIPEAPAENWIQARREQEKRRSQARRFS